MERGRGKKKKKNALVLSRPGCKVISQRSSIRLSAMRSADSDISLLDSLAWTVIKVVMGVQGAQKSPCEA